MFLRCKTNANREQNLPSFLRQLCRDAAMLMQSYKFSLKQMLKCLDYFCIYNNLTFLAAFVTTQHPLQHELVNRTR